MLACLIALLLGPPVEIDGQGLDDPATSPLHGQVLERVLEAGYPLHPGAATRVELISEGAAVLVMVHAAGERWEERVPAAGRDVAVVGLDVAHRVVALLSAHAVAGGEPRPSTVRLDPALVDGELRQALLRALAERGTTVAPPGEAARHVACGSWGDAGARVALGDDAAACREALEDASPRPTVDEGLKHAWLRASWPEDEPDDGQQNDGQQNDQQQEDDDEEPAEGDAPGEPGAHREASSETEPPVGERVLPRRSTPLELTVAAEAGLSVRPEVDGRYGGSVVVGRQRGPAGVFELAVLPARGDAELRVADVAVAAGFGWRVVLAPRWRLVPGLVAGARVHTYRFPDEPARAGLDPHVSIPLRLEWRPLPRFVLGLRLAAAFDGRTRGHRVNRLDAYRRGPWRLDVGVQLGVAFGRGLQRGDPVSPVARARGRRP